MVYERVQDPTHNLSPLRKVFYILKSISESRTRKEIVDELLRDDDIEKIVSAFKDYKDIDGYCHIADLEELKENEFNLNVPRYVDISKPEEEIDIQTIIDELKKLESERQELEIQVNAYLKAQAHRNFTNL